MIVKKTGSSAAAFRFSSMSGTKTFVGAAAPAGNQITSLDDWGFTLGSDVLVNDNTIAHYWIAFASISGEVKIGTYTGNGGSANAITGLGFQPESVWIATTTGSAIAFYKHTGLSSTNSCPFKLGAAVTDCIKSLDSDGFTLDVNAVCNTNSEVYAYIAFNDTTSKIRVAGYAGNGSDNRPITSGIGWQPQVVFVQRNCTDATQREMGFHPATLGLATDVTLSVGGVSNSADLIQQILTTGFQVGLSDKVNSNTVNYLYMVLGENPPTAAPELKWADTLAPGAEDPQWTAAHDPRVLAYRWVSESSTGQRHHSPWLASPMSLSGQRRARRGALRRGPAHYLRRGESSLASSDSAVVYLEKLDIYGAKKGPTRSALVQHSEPAQAMSRTADHTSPFEPLGGDALFVLSDEQPVDAAGFEHNPGRRTSLPTPTPEEQAAHRAHLAAGAVKVCTHTEGIYGLRGSELLAAGNAVSWDPAELALLCAGKPVAITATQQHPGTVTEDLAIEFYGFGIESRWSKARCCWLGPGTPSQRLRMALDNPPQQGRGTAAEGLNVGSHRREEVVLDRRVYYAAVTNGADADNFFGQPVSQKSTISYAITLDDSALEDIGATLRVNAQMISSAPGLMEIAFDGAPLGQMALAPQASATQVFALPVGAASAGDPGRSGSPSEADSGGQQRGAVVDSLW